MLTIPSVHPLHLISVLWEDNSTEPTAGQPTLLKSSIEHLGGNATQFNRALLSRLNKLPVVDPPPAPPLPLTQSYHSVLREAQKLQKDSGGDQFIAVDHLILALIKVDLSELKDLLKAAGTNGKALEGEVKRKRGGRKADSRSAESQFDALNKCKSTRSYVNY